MSPDYLIMRSIFFYFFMTHTCYLKALAKWVSDCMTGVFMRPLMINFARFLFSFVPITKTIAKLSTLSFILLLLKQTVWFKVLVRFKTWKKRKVSLFLNTCQDLLTNNWSLEAVDAGIQSCCRHSWHSASACVFFRSRSEAMKCPPAEKRAESTWNGECLSYKETRNLVRPVSTCMLTHPTPTPSAFTLPVRASFCGGDTQETQSTLFRVTSK